MRNKRIPRKLQHDAIIEAVLEIRFDMATIPEVFFGRLVDHASWKGFEQRRLPAYEIPAAMRQANANLRYQAVFELRSPKHDRAIRVGAQVLSYHKLVPYGGWEEFKPQLQETISALFSKAEDLTVRRLGLRYLNAIRPEPHRISSVVALDLRVAVANEDISGRVNLNFTTELSKDTDCTVRIATKEFVGGVVPQDTSVFIDVDVFTKDHYRTKTAEDVNRWIDFAHEREKEQFFRLLTDASIDALEVKE